MKKDIHPHWQECTVTCACGNTFVTGGTTATMQVDICHKCHPFFTGEQRFVDKEGRLEKFQKKMALSKKLREQQAKLDAQKQAAKKAQADKPTDTRTFKQMLNDAKAQAAKAAQEEQKSTSDLTNAKKA
ncbi:50S ribosomal protein L31 [bacterium]|nr:50S ribosomal protein L31 [bacterium]